MFKLKTYRRTTVRVLPLSKANKLSDTKLFQQQKAFGPGWAAQLVRALSQNTRGVGSISSQSTCEKHQ